MKNLLSENMMRFGTKNLTEAAKKELTLKSIMETIDEHGLQKEVRAALSEQMRDPNLGLAQKIVGMMWKAMSGLGTDNQKVLNAVMMIKTKDIYNSVLKIVKTSPKIKTEFGRNFPTVGAWLSTDMASYDSTDLGALDAKTNAIVEKIRVHLQRISGDATEGITSGGARDVIDRDLRGE
jgi:hypothetical protein